MVDRLVNCTTRGKRRRDSIAYSFVQPPPPTSPTLLLVLIKRHDASNLHITHFQSLRLLVHLAFHGDSVGEGGVAVPLPLSLGHTEGALPPSAEEVAQEPRTNCGSNSGLPPVEHPMVSGPQESVGRGH